MSKNQHKKQTKKKKKLQRLANQSHREEPKKVSRIPVYPILLFLIIVGAFLLRVLPQWNKVFQSDGTIFFREVDPYYQMRLVDAMVHNFPSFLRWDMFTIYPEGAAVGFSSILTFIIAIPSLVLGLGHPSEYLIQMVGLFTPVIIFGLIPIPIYMLGKELFNSRSVGIIGALLVTLLPGEILHRSLLGFTDQHILEVLLTTLVLLFVVMGIKRQKLWYAILAGLTFGIYQMAWHGGLFFIFIFWVWFIVQFLHNTYKGIPNAFLCKFVAILLVIPSLSMLGFWRPVEAPAMLKFRTMASVLAVIIPVILWLIARTFKDWKKVLLITSTLFLAPLLVALIIPNVKDLLITMSINQIKSVFWGFGSSIAEAMPTTPDVAFSNFGIPLILALVGLFILIRKHLNLLVVVWTLILLLAQIGQRRWGYYYAVPVALLTGATIVWVSGMVKEKARIPVFIILIFFTFLPSANPTWGIANMPTNMGPAWYNSLIWLKENSPEPFTTPDAYLQTNLKEKPTYGILAWWDFGHWITYVSHRVPVSNPAYQDVAAGSRFFASRTVEEARAEIEGLDIRYIILSQDVLTGKWYAVIKKANKSTPVQESVAAMLWLNNYPDYKLVHEEGSVKIYEKTAE